MLLRTSRLTRQCKVWQNRTGWKFQFAHINPETKYQKAFVKMLFGICALQLEKTRQKHWRSLGMAALCAVQNSAAALICFPSDHRAQHTPSAGSAAAGPLLSTGAAHLTTQAFFLLWGYPKMQLKDALQESRSVCGKKLFWNLLVRGSEMCAIDQAIPADIRVASFNQKVRFVLIKSQLCSYPKIRDYPLA